MAANLSVKDVLFICELSFFSGILPVISLPLPIGENSIVFASFSSIFGIAFDSVVLLSTSLIICSGVSRSTSATVALFLF